MKHRVYLVKYNTDLRLAEYHQAIFISSTEDSKEVRERDRIGWLYHVMGPEQIKVDCQEFKFKAENDKTPARSRAYRYMIEIGHIQSSKLAIVAMICSDVQPPLVPIRYDGEPPNCCDWVNNVLYQLNKEKVIQFNRDFKVPSHEIRMIAKSIASAKKGSSEPHSDGVTLEINFPKHLAATLEPIGGHAMHNALSSKSGYKSSSSKSGHEASSSKSGDKASSSKSGNKASPMKSSKALSSKHEKKH